MRWCPSTENAQPGVAGVGDLQGGTEPVSALAVQPMEGNLEVRLVALARDGVRMAHLSSAGLVVGDPSAEENARLLHERVEGARGVR